MFFPRMTRRFLSACVGLVVLEAARFGVDVRSPSGYGDSSTSVVSARKRREGIRREEVELFERAMNGERLVHVDNPGCISAPAVAAIAGCGFVICCFRAQRHSPGSLLPLQKAELYATLLRECDGRLPSYDCCGRQITGYGRAIDTDGSSADVCDVGAGSLLQEDTPQAGIFEDIFGRFSRPEEDHKLPLGFAKSSRWQLSDEESRYRKEWLQNDYSEDTRVGRLMDRLGGVLHHILTSDRDLEHFQNGTRQQQAVLTFVKKVGVWGPDDSWDSAFWHIDERHGRFRRRLTELGNLVLVCSETARDEVGKFPGERSKHPLFLWVQKHFRIAEDPDARNAEDYAVFVQLAATLSHLEKMFGGDDVGFCGRLSRLC